MGTPHANTFRTCKTFAASVSVYVSNFMRHTAKKGTEQTAQRHGTRQRRRKKQSMTIVLIIHSIHLYNVQEKWMS